MYIAICDDDSKVTNRLKSDIYTLFKSIKDDVDISVFSKGTDLIETIKNEELHYDVLLLDVDMPDISGLEVAKILRETNEDIIIIFISSYEKYVFDSFEYNPFRFIRKNRIKEELSIALKSAYALYKKREGRYIVIKSDDGEYRVEQSKICYFEIVKRKLFIHLADNKVLSMWKPIKDFINEIKDGDFVKIHSGCAVNMKYIKEYTNYDVTLDNGEKLITSRSGIKTLKEELNKYWGEKI
ncbi:MAG: LytR/AlgR family response regulator transcription factor [Butyrivibrio sp.]